MTEVPTLGVHIDERKILEDKLDILGIDKSKYLRTKEEVGAIQKQQGEQQQQQHQLAMAMMQQEKQAEAQGKIAVEQAKGQITAQLKQAELATDGQENEKDRDHEIKKELIKIEATERQDDRNVSS